MDTERAESGYCHSCGPLDEFSLIAFPSWLGSWYFIDEYASSGCHHAETRMGRFQLRHRTQRLALLQCCIRRTVTAARQESATERCEPLRRLDTSPGSPTDEMPRPTGRCRETGNANRAPNRRTHRQRAAWGAPRRRIDLPFCHDRSLPRSLAWPPCGSDQALRRTESRPTRTPRHSVASGPDRKSTRLNSSHHSISYAVFCLK